MKIFAIMVLAVVGLSGCANLGSKPTAGLCNEIFKFANATPLDENARVKFRTSWGSGFNSDEDAFFEY
jgi:hypothetical protein